MREAICVAPGRILLDDKPVRDAGPLDAFVRLVVGSMFSQDGGHAVHGWKAMAGRNPPLSAG